jgi:hypothetical protein
VVRTWFALKRQATFRSTMQLVIKAVLSPECRQLKFFFR